MVVDRLDHIFVLLFKAIMAIIDSCFNSFSDDFCIDVLQSFGLLLKIIDCLSERFKFVVPFWCSYWMEFFVLLFKTIMAIIDSCLNSFSDDFCIDVLQSFELLLKIID